MAILLVKVALSFRALYNYKCQPQGGRGGGGGRETHRNLTAVGTPGGGILII